MDSSSTSEGSGPDDNHGNHHGGTGTSSGSISGGGGSISGQQQPSSSEGGVVAKRAFFAASTTTDRRDGDDDDDDVSGGGVFFGSNSNNNNDKKKSATTIIKTKICLKFLNWPDEEEYREVYFRNNKTNQGLFSYPITITSLLTEEDLEIPANNFVPVIIGQTYTPFFINDKDDDGIEYDICNDDGSRLLFPSNDSTWIFPSKMSSSRSGVRTTFSAVVKSRTDIPIHLVKKRPGNHHDNNNNNNNSNNNWIVNPSDDYIVMEGLEFGDKVQAFYIPNEEVGGGGGYGGGEQRLVPYIDHTTWLQLEFEFTRHGELFRRGKPFTIPDRCFELLPRRFTWNPPNSAFMTPEEERAWNRANFRMWALADRTRHPSHPPKVLVKNLSSKDTVLLRNSITGNLLFNEVLKTKQEKDGSCRSYHTFIPYFLDDEEGSMVQCFYDPWGRRIEFRRRIDISDCDTDEWVIPPDLLLTTHKRCILQLTFVNPDEQQRKVELRRTRTNYSTTLNPKESLTVYFVEIGEKFKFIFFEEEEEESSSGVPYYNMGGVNKRKVFSSKTEIEFEALADGMFTIPVITPWAFHDGIDSRPTKRPKTSSPKRGFIFGSDAKKKDDVTNSNSGTGSGSTVRLPRGPLEDWDFGLFLLGITHSSSSSIGSSNKSNPLLSMLRGKDGPLKIIYDFTGKPPLSFIFQNQLKDKYSCSCGTHNPIELPNCAACEWPREYGREG